MRTIAFVTLAMCSAAFAASSGDDPQLRNGDPARWAEPIVTPAQRLESSLKESRNALADTLRECRSSSERKACETEARAQYQREVLAAKKQAADRPQ